MAAPLPPRKLCRCGCMTWPLPSSPCPILRTWARPYPSPSTSRTPIIQRPSRSTCPRASRAASARPDRSPSRFRSSRPAKRPASRSATRSPTTTRRPGRSPSGLMPTSGTTGTRFPRTTNCSRRRGRSAESRLRRGRPTSRPLPCRGHPVLEWVVAGAGAMIAFCLVCGMRRARRWSRRIMLARPAVRRHIDWRRPDAGQVRSQPMDQRVSLVTLGVTDLNRARDFYEAMGWRPTSEVVGDVVFFQAGGMVVALWGRAKLAEDSAVRDSGGWGGMTLAHNVKSAEAVDAVINEARAAGAVIGREPAKTFWGGYSGVFIDPDGDPWEVAHNPGWTLNADGSVSLTG